MSKDREAIGKVDGKKRRGGDKKKDRSKGKEFMDAAVDAFVRGQSLLLWRDFIIYRDRAGKTPSVALRDTGFFADKGEYAELWEELWGRTVLAKPGTTDGEIFGQIESAVQQAVLQEKALRLERGGPTLEDTEDYNRFVREKLGQLVSDAGAIRDF